MLAINGVYDKGKIELIKEVPIKGKRRVVVTFLDEPLVETDLGLGIDPIRALKGCVRGLNLTEKGTKPNDNGRTELCINCVKDIHRKTI
jgi:hypothetical protein